MDDERFRSLLDTARVVNSSNDLAGTLEHIVIALCRNGMWSTSAIMVVDHSEEITKRVARFDPAGLEDAELQQSWDLSTSPARFVIESGTPIVIPDARSSTDFPGYQMDAAARGYRTVVVLPLNSGDERGRPMVAAVQSKTVVDVNASELSYLEAICELAAIAVRKIHVIRRERETLTRLEVSTRHSADLMELVLGNAKIDRVLEFAEGLMDPETSLVLIADNMIYAGRPPASAPFSPVEWRKAVSSQLWQHAESRSNTLPASRDFNAKLSGQSKPFAATIEPLTLDGREVGRIFVFGKSAESPVARLLLNQTRFALSVAILREHVRKQSLNETRADVLLALLTSEIRDQAALVERAARYGLHLDVDHRLIGVAPSRLQPAGSEAIASSKIDLPGSDGILARSGDMSWILIAGGVPASSITSRVEQAFSSHWGAPPVIAVSGVLGRPEDYPAAARRLQRVLDIARRFGRTGLVPERLSSSHLALLAGLDPREAREFADRHIGPLSKDDDALTSIKAYLDNSGRLQAAADSLSIHVSTLRYRLDKLREAYQIDLQAPDTRLNIELALALTELLGSAGSGRLQQKLGKED
jgi:purine catabolism regulator